MIKVDEKELRAVRQAIFLGHVYGYGNIVSHLLSAWADVLTSQGVDPGIAVSHVSNREPLPIQMHLDIVNNGEWDETGAKYSP
jgi:hypothetical protein